MVAATASAPSPAPALASGIANGAVTLRATPNLPREVFERVRRRTIFECFKLDPQVEDVSVLAPFALLITRDTWRDLAALAEKLARETLAAEHEIVRKPELTRRLGLPRRIVGCQTVRARAEHGLETRDTGEIARLMRFDFHLTTEGWRITEVNSDVPGGFIEASGFTRLVAEHVAGAQMAGDPAQELAQVLARQLPAGALVGLVHATAYTDDRQVMIFLSRQLESAGLRTCLLAPDQIDWRGGRAHLRTDWCRQRADAIVRFFPGEWLVNLPRRSGWRHFFAGSGTPLCNPATALVTQSKRFPLVWDDLETTLPTWRALLPHTRDPRDVDWRRDERWILKPALGRVGDAIGMRGVTGVKEWHRIARWARWRPGRWAAQRRFEALPVHTDDGPVYPCIGVYTIDGRACGIYGRAATAPLINHVARDVAVLVAAGESYPPMSTTRTSTEPKDAS